MASDRSTPARGAPAPEARKTELLRRVLTLSQQEVLLVDMEGLAGLLEEKERLIAVLQRIDEELAARADAAPSAEAEPSADAEQEEQARLLAIILENERAVEGRMNSERQRLKGELRELERETRLRRYLERPNARRIKVDLKQ